MALVPTIEDLLRFQRAYYELLSTWECRPWGVIGLNLDNPTSHDSNHAYADTRLTPRVLPQVLEEVADWYAARSGGQIDPRLRCYSPPTDLGLMPAAERLGWEADNAQQIWRTWLAAAGHQQPADVPGLTLSVVGPESLEAVLATHDGGEARHRRVWSALAGSDRTDCLLARIEGEPAAVLACLWSQGWGSVENVYTRERFRRRGICGAMIRHLQGLAAERGAAGLYLYDNEEAPDRIYARAGFELVARVWWVQFWRQAAA